MKALSDYFERIHRFHRGNELDRTVVVLHELPSMLETVGSPRLRSAIQSFIMRHTPNGKQSAS